jgi:anti-sigma regulatory factor (Ser/Thr protein kinase)
VVEALLPAEPDDDVAVLTASVVSGPQRAITVPIAAGPAGVADVRNAVTRALADWGVPRDAAADVQLIVSELATNCVRYGAPPMQCKVRLDGDRVVVDTWDAASTRPHLRPFDPAAPNGRGLHLVAGLAGAWGVRPTGAGKAVWCTVPFGSGS